MPGGARLVGADVQLRPPNSQITRMIGNGIPIIHKSKPRPIFSSRLHVAFDCRKNAEPLSGFRSGFFVVLRTILPSHAGRLTKIKADLRENRASHASTNCVERF